MIENGTVLIDGNRIAAVGPTAAVTYPAGTRTIDMSGKTIVPGFFDAHWHGPHASDQIVPDQDWVYYNAARLRRDDRPRSFRRHARGVRLVGAAEGRQDPRPAHLLDRHHPLRRRDAVHGRDQHRSTTRSPTSAA